jgi:hypothetical protein
LIGSTICCVKAVWRKLPRHIAGAAFSTVLEEVQAERAVNEPVLAAAQFEQYMERPFSALIQLKTDLLQGRIVEKTPQVRRVMAEMYLIYGAQKEAIRLFSVLQKEGQLFFQSNHG